MTKRREALAGLLLLILGLGPRLWFVFRLPTIPVSDFANVVSFATYLRTHGLLSNGWWFWQVLNVGAPLVLSGVFRIFPSVEPAAVARMATAVACGVVPLLPLVIWRGVFSLRMRLLAGAALALWPGQLQFSGVVAQDNWVLLPGVALAALAVRALSSPERAWPVTAGLLYGAGVAMRADTMVMLLPLLLAAVRVDRIRSMRRQVLAGGLAAGLSLLGLAAYRQAAIGRFALTPEMSGMAILGGFVPGASINGWEPPYAYIASVRPEVLRDRAAMITEPSHLAAREALRRPGFHALRIFAMLCFFGMDAEANTMHWSLGSPEVLPPELQAQGVGLAVRLGPWLHVEMAAIQGLFLAAVMVGFRRRSPAVLVLASAVGLKYALHGFSTFQGRFFLVATALEILGIAIAADLVWPSVPRRALAVGAAFGLALLIFAPRLMAMVQSRDVDPEQRTYHFQLEPPDHRARLACVVEHGALVTLWPGAEAAIRTLRPGEEAVAECHLTGSPDPRPLIFQVFGGRAVELDGEEVFHRETGEEPVSIWANIPLGDAKRVILRASAGFRLARSSSTVHLAMARQTAQSSVLAGYTTVGSMSAVDGNVDGNFFRGSVTATNQEAHAWWQVDLGGSRAIGSIAIWNRTDCCGTRLSDYWVFVSDTPFLASDTPATLQKRAATWGIHQTVAPAPSTRIAAPQVRGRYVRVQLTGTDYLSLAEVQVFGR